MPESLHNFSSMHTVACPVHVHASSTHGHPTPLFCNVRHLVHTLLHLLEMLQVHSLVPRLSPLRRGGGAWEQGYVLVAFSIGAAEYDLSRESLGTRLTSTHTNTKKRRGLFAAEA